jgi:ketopantoate reductase
MRLVIELANEQEREVVTAKIDEVKKIFNNEIEIIYADKSSSYVFDKMEKLKWDMGRKLYQDRESLYER